MKAIILAGGYGTRLRPLTNSIPKPMVPIVDKPVLEYIVNHLKKHGIKDIAMTLGYKSDNIVNYFGDGNKWGLNIRYYIENKPLGTAGAVRNAEEFIDDTFLVMSGDALTNVDITRMLSFHKRRHALATMSVKRVDNPDGFGVVKTDKNGRVKSFIEKPKVALDNKVNMGIYIMEKEVLKYIPEGEKYDFSLDLFPRILDHMYAYSSDCYWSDIGTLSSYYLTNNDVVTHQEYFGVRF